MRIITKEQLEALRSRYPAGTRVELLQMDDAQAPPTGTCGTVIGVDDTGSLLVNWDNGSGLNVLYGIDRVRKVEAEMDEYEIIQKQSKEVLTRTIADFIALHLMQAVMYGVPTDYEFLRKEVAKELDSRDLVSNEERQWKVHPDGFGQYCLDMMVYEMKKAKKEIENK